MITSICCSRLSRTKFTAYPETRIVSVGISRDGPSHPTAFRDSAHSRSCGSQSLRRKRQECFAGSRHGLPLLFPDPQDQGAGERDAVGCVSIGDLATDAAEAWIPCVSRPCIGFAPGAKGSPRRRPSGVLPVFFPYTTFEVIVSTDCVCMAFR